MTPSQRKAVLIDFVRYIRSKYDVSQENQYNKIMNTTRRFKADYYLQPNILIEINGGQWTTGRHNRGGKGYENDLTKLNIAQNNGFKVYQFTYEMLMRREYTNFI